MNSKEALETLSNVKVAVTTIRSGITHFKTLKEQYEVEFEVLERELFIRKELKDFDVYQRQLEKLEKEHNKLKERYKHRAETSNDLCKAVKQYEKAIEILKDKLEITLYSHDEYFNPPMINGTEIFKNLTQEEYELLKEVLEND